MLTNIESTPRVGDTLVPLIFMFDGTQLSNFAGEKIRWPVYMTTGNLSSKMRQMLLTQSVVIVALLPVPTKNRNINQKQLDEQGQTHQEVLNAVLRRVLWPLNFRQNPRPKSGYYNVLCADGNFRCCNAVLAAWLADRPE